LGKRLGLIVGLAARGEERGEERKRDTGNKTQCTFYIVKIRKVYGKVRGVRKFKGRGGKGDRGGVRQHYGQKTQGTISLFGDKEGEVFRQIAL